jgi:hypothetical protein
MANFMTSASGGRPHSMVSLHIGAIKRGVLWFPRQHRDKAPSFGGLTRAGNRRLDIPSACRTDSGVERLGVMRCDGCHVDHRVPLHSIIKAGARARKHRVDCNAICQDQNDNVAAREHLARVGGDNGSGGAQRVAFRGRAVPDEERRTDFHHVAGHGLAHGAKADESHGL